MNKIVLGAVAGALAFTSISAQDEVADVEFAANETAVVESSYDSVYAFLGIGGSFLESKARLVDWSRNHDTNRFVGVIGLGGGKAFNGKFYAGAEALLDWGKTDKKTLYQDNGAEWGQSKSNGLRPAIALRLGYVCPNNFLAYLKFAGVWSKASLEGPNANGVRTKKNINKFVPEIDLGVEKAFCKKFSTRIEAGYVWRAKQTNCIIDNLTVEANKGWNVRALVAYNIKY
ncbi:MAG: hypothetical protein IJA14_01760 [Alphaproteobacteria bacterium]|nr:hypothetical protein [Alphaproteobacteria bacterium]